jgi:hypothetical protein
MEPSRQSTSDSDAYRGHGSASKNKVAEGGGEDDLAELVAGLEELVEEPEFNDEEPTWDAKGKMKMPEPQYFGTRLSTTQEEDEDIYGDEGEQTMRMPEPFTHSRDQSSSVPQIFYPQPPSAHPSSFSTGPTVRKVSPLIIPPTPKSPPPVPLSIRGEKQLPIVTPTGHGKSSSSTEPKPDEDSASHLLRAVPSNTGGGPGGTAPLRVQRHSKRPSSATTAGGEGISSAATSTEKDSGSPQSYGTATITGVTSSRIERPERPGSSGGGGLTAPARTSMGTGSTNISGTASGRVRDNTSHRPSIDAHTYAHGRTTSNASASGVNRPPERRMSGGSAQLPPLPRQEKEKPSVSTSASAAVAAATIPRGGLPRGVSSQMDTQYVNMLLALDDIPAIHNFAVAFFNWIYLAGFVLFPGTFTSLKNLGADQGNGVAAELINSVTQLPL